MAKRKRTTRKKNPSTNLAKAINDAVDARVSKALEKQNPRLQKTLAGMVKALARIEFFSMPSVCISPLPS